MGVTDSLVSLGGLVVKVHDAKLRAELQQAIVLHPVETA